MKLSSIFPKIRVKSSIFSLQRYEILNFGSNLQSLGTILSIFNLLSLNIYVKRPLIFNLNENTWGLPTNWVCVWRRLRKKLMLTWKGKRDWFIFLRLLLFVVVTPDHHLLGFQNFHDYHIHSATWHPHTSSPGKNILSSEVLRKYLYTYEAAISYKIQIQHSRMSLLTNAHMWLQASRERRPDRSYTLLILWHAVEQKTTQAVPKFYQKIYCFF